MLENEESEVSLQEEWPHPSPFTLKFLFLEICLWLLALKLFFYSLLYLLSCFHITGSANDTICQRCQEGEKQITWKSIAVRECPRGRRVCRVVLRRETRIVSRIFWGKINLHNFYERVTVKDPLLYENTRVQVGDWWPEWLPLWYTLSNVFYVVIKLRYLIAPKEKRKTVFFWRFIFCWVIIIYLLLASHI